MTMGFGLGLTLVSLVIWVGLLTLWGQFWRCDQRLAASQGQPILETWPSVWVVIPARNEADVLPVSLRSHLTQTYPGPLHVLLVDDQSTDGTSEVAHQVAADLGKAEQLTILNGSALPPGWTGKLWAMEQGYRWLKQLKAASAPKAELPSSLPEERTGGGIGYVLFTDADINHSPTNLQDLVTKAETERLDLTSLMVLLRRETFWETLLIPAFVFFFQMLYPFPWVNNPKRSMAGAAGGCMLLRFSALESIGGLACIRDALIDDCALGAAVKAKGPIWLGLTDTTTSLRPYPTLQSIWNMVARSAYTQLRYSPWLLAGTVIGMGLVYLVLPVSTVVGLVTGHWLLAGTGLLGWGLMALAYWPTLKLYGCPPWLAFSLPWIALLYTLMTLDSALRHWRGQGGAWKGRVYPKSG
jgi:hopene-associated glycosyltransferase HpnB